MLNKRGTSHTGIQKSLHDFFHEQLNKQDGNDHKFDQENAYRALALFASHENVLPRSFMTDSFKKFSKLLNPQLRLTSENIEQHCLDIYKEEKILAKQLLESCDGNISLSFDVMRYDGARTLADISFIMCLQAHFVDSDWNLKNWVLSYFEPFSNNKDPGKAIMGALLDFNLCNKISTLTLGDINGNDPITEFVRDNIERKRELKELIFRVHCCADTFRHMVDYAIQRLHRVMDYVPLVVSSEKLPLMWSIIISDLQKSIEMESKREYTDNDEDCYLNIPSESEWKKIRFVGKLAGLIYNAAKALFETKNPTASMYLHNIWELKLSLAKETTNSDQFMKVTAMGLMKTLDRYWEDMSLFLAVSTVMDPRCKMKYVEFFSCKYEDIGGNLRAAYVLETIEGLFKNYAASDLEVENAGRDFPMSDAVNPKSEDHFARPKDVKERCGSPSFWFSHLDEYNKFVESNSQPLKSELELYLEAPVVPLDGEFKLLSWWKSATPKYPTLAKIARDLLAIPLTLATQEDAYVMEFRSPDVGLISLKPELMNALKCTRSWYEQPNKEKD